MSTQNRTQARKKTSVSSHPLFPAIVALWFGALFGLGSLAVRPSILESLVLSSHLDVIVPMTAPPLGMTARILLALTMAVIGVAAGAMIARRIARPKPVERQRRRSAATVSEKPGSRHETAYAQAPQPQPETAPEPESMPLAVPSGRRRSLAMEPEQRDDYRLDAAPLPGGFPAIFDVTQIDMAEPEATAAQGAEPEQAKPVMELQPLELGSFAAPEPAPEPADAAPFAGDIAALSEAVGPEADDCLVLDEPVAVPVQRQVFGEPQSASGDPAGESLAPAEFAAEPESPLAFTPVPDNPAMSAFEPQPALRQFDGPADAGLFGASASPPKVVEEPAPAAGMVLPKDGAAQRIASANLAELSPVELIERFALALQQRRSNRAMPTGLAEAVAGFAPAAPVPAPIAAPAPSSAPSPAPEAEAEAAPIAAAPSPLALPAALRPIDFSAFEDNDDYHSFAPPRSIGMPAPVAAPEPLAEPAIAPASIEAAAADAPAPAEIAMEVEAAEVETDVLEEGYSSLLDLNRPAAQRQTFVRIEEPLAESAPVEPVVIFPGQDARAGMRFARPVEVAPQDADQAAPEPATPEPGVTPLRRFDAPGAVAAPAASPQDPAEAERALRSALATLQRMSGAA